MKQQASTVATVKLPTVGRIIHVLGRQGEIRPAIVYKTFRELVFARCIDEGGEYDRLNLTYTKEPLEKSSQWTWPPRDA